MKGRIWAKIRFCAEGRWEQPPFGTVMTTTHRPPHWLAVPSPARPQTPTTARACALPLLDRSPKKSGVRSASFDATGCPAGDGRGARTGVARACSKPSSDRQALRRPPRSALCCFHVDRNRACAVVAVGSALLLRIAPPLAFEGFGQRRGTGQPCLKAKSLPTRFTASHRIRRPSRKPRSM
jgi:hypothetical protein